MKFSTALLTFFFSACALGSIAWVGYLHPISVRDTANLKKWGYLKEPEIEIVGPQPKAVAVDPVFNLGRAIIGQEYSHVFILKNEGELPLTLEKGKSTCECTVSSLKEGKVLELPPGESVEITLTWTPTHKAPQARESAEIITNDPKNPLVRFTIESNLVIELLTARPKNVWTMPMIRDDAPVKYSGYIYSVAIEDFQIEEITTTNPLLTAKYFKMDESDHKRTQQRIFGYRIELELKQGSPLGVFNESMTVVTNLKDVDPLILNIRTHRRSPITIRPIKNSRWNRYKSRVDMGDFAAADGRISTLHLYVPNFGDKDLEFREIEADPEFLKLSLHRDDSYQGKGSKRYLLIFEIPPGSPKVIRNNESSALVHLKTNHPEVTEMTFHVDIISR